MTITITVEISIACIPVLESVDNDNEEGIYRVDWRILSEVAKEVYANNTNLNNVSLSIRCKDTRCTDVQHRVALNVFYVIWSVV